MSISVDRRNEQKRHAKELKNLRDSNKNEIERQKVNHEMNKSQIKQAATLELNSLRAQNDFRALEESRRNDRVLNNLKDNLDQVKEITQKEKNRIEKMFAGEKEKQKAIFQETVKSRKDINNLVLEDIEHEKSIEMQRMKRESNRLKEDLRQELIDQKVSVKDNLLTDISLTKDKYTSEKFAQELKYSKALLNQKKKNENEIVNKERSFKDKIDSRQKYFKTEINKNEEIGKKTISNQQLKFEEKFKNNYKRNEKTLQTLAHNKEKILDKLRQNIKQDLKSEMIKDDDPFYKKVDYSPKVSMNSDQDKYLVEIEVPKHEANKFNLTAEGRNIKLSMQRDFSFTRNEDGRVSKTKKYETISEKFGVSEIVDSKSIKKSYSDGVLTFEVGLA